MTVSGMIGRRRAGVFLNTPRSSGGAFQYSQVLVEAMRALPRDRTDLVLLSPYADYRSLAEDCGASFVHLPLDLRERAIGRLTSGKAVPPALYRRFRLAFSSWVRTIDAQGLSWVAYPSQDHLSFCTRTPAIATIHDLMHRYETEFPELRDGGEYERRECLYKGIARWAKAILVDSELGRRHVLECYPSCPSDSVHVLPFAAPPVRTGILQPTGELPELPSRFLFYPAQFWPHKNHLRLVEALALLKDRHPDMRLVFAGGAKGGHQAVVDAVGRLGLGHAVIFLGYVSDVAVQELYRRADALVMPSLLGPTNIPPLEAFSAGCPVVASRVYAVPEQLGDAALLVDPRSVPEIAAALDSVWTDSDLRRGLVARGRIRSAELSQDAFSARFAEIVEAAFP